MTASNPPSAEYLAEMDLIGTLQDLPMYPTTVVSPGDDAAVRASLGECLLRGWAVRHPDGRILITNAGKDAIDAAYRHIPKCAQPVPVEPPAGFGCRDECSSPQPVATNRTAPMPYIGRGGLIVEGVRLPHITATIVEGEEDRGDPLISLVCDGRLGHCMPLSEVQRIAWFLGSCMAVAAGFSCVGENSTSMPISQGNPYRGDLFC